MDTKDHIGWRSEDTHDTSVDQRPSLATIPETLIQAIDERGNRRWRGRMQWGWTR